MRSSTTPPVSVAAHRVLRLARPDAAQVVGEAGVDEVGGARPGHPRLAQVRRRRRCRPARAPPCARRRHHRRGTRSASTSPRSRPSWRRGRRAGRGAVSCRSVGHGRHVTACGRRPPAVDSLPGMTSLSLTDPTARRARRRRPRRRLGADPRRRRPRAPATGLPAQGRGAPAGGARRRSRPPGKADEVVARRRGAGRQGHLGRRHRCSATARRAGRPTRTPRCASRRRGGPAQRPRQAQRRGRAADARRREPVGRRRRRLRRVLRLRQAAPLGARRGTGLAAPRPRDHGAGPRVLVVSGAGQGKAAKDAVARAAVLGAARDWARDLVNPPPNLPLPAVLRRQRQEAGRRVHRARSRSRCSTTRRWSRAASAASSASARARSTRRAS